MDMHSISTPARRGASIAARIVFVLAAATFRPQPLAAVDWETLFTAQDVRDHLSTEQGREAALEFCRHLGLKKVYLETFRDGYQANEETLKAARDVFCQAGFEVSGGVTTTQIGKPSTGWNIVACYTNRANQERLKLIFRAAAGIFDEIMIDDFFFTDCECSECSAAKGAMSWPQYREKLMLEVSRDDVLGPARQANPRVKIILKFPQWYDKFQDRGYFPSEQSEIFDRIWVGTELRDPSSDKWGHAQQYRGFFLYRWLADVAGPKTGGGWFDPYGTDPAFYLDQAYVTVLAGAPEVFLFHYGSLASPEFHPQAEALAAHRAELDDLAKLAGDWKGIPAYKPPSSDPGDENYIYDQIGMLGIPLQPASRFPEGARVAVFATQALGDQEFVPKLSRFLDAGGTAFATESLARRLNKDPRLAAAGVVELAKGEYFKTIREGAGRMIVFSDALPRLTYVDSKGRIESLTPELRAALESLRQVVADFAVTSLDAPPRVAVFPLGGRVAVVNFTELPVGCRLAGAGGKASRFRKVFAAGEATLASDGVTLRLPPHAVLVVESPSR